MQLGIFIITWPSQIRTKKTAPENWGGFLVFSKKN
jgi:hypothetical protein